MSTIINGNGDLFFVAITVGVGVEMSRLPKGELDEGVVVPVARLSIEGLSTLGAPIVEPSIGAETSEVSSGADSGDCSAAGSSCSDADSDGASENCLGDCSDTSEDCSSGDSGDCSGDGSVSNSDGASARDSSFGSVDSSK